MDIVEEILAAIEDGISPKEIASQLTWESLTEDEREQLLASARELGGSQHGYELLVLLYTLSQDDWFTARVLGYVVGHPSLAQAERQNTLKTLRRLLDKTRTRLAGLKDAGQKLRWQQLYEAGYLALTAQVAEEDGRLDEALKNYRQALAIYQELGFAQAAERIDRLIQANLTARPPLKAAPPAAPVRLPRSTVHAGARPPGPPPGVPDQPAAPPPQTELERLAAQIKAQAQTLNELVAKTKEKQEQHERLSREVTALEQKARSRQQDLEVPAKENGFSEKSPVSKDNPAAQRLENLRQELATEKERSTQLLGKLRLSENRPALKTPASPQVEVSQELEELKSQLSEAREEEEQLAHRIQQKQVRLEKLEQLGMQKENLLQEVAALKRQLREMTRELETLTTQKQEVELEHKRRRAELEKLDSEIHSRSIEKQKMEKKT
jgi:HAMP domain-containing protein